MKNFRPKSKRLKSEAVSCFLVMPGKVLPEHEDESRYSELWPWYLPHYFLLAGDENPNFCHDPDSWAEWEVMLPEAPGG
jgi:hypothetical protein